MQQNLRQAYIDLIGDPHASASRKGKAALQLCSSSAIGFGCKKSIDDALEYLRTAATFRNNPAQLVCHRVFAAHGRPSPVLQTDLFPVYSLVDSDESLGQTSDEDMEEGDHWQSETDDEKMDNGDTYSEGEMDMREAQSHFANQSDWGSQSSYHGSDISTLYAVFHLSGGFDQEFRRLTDVCDNDYYCWSIRMFEQCNGNANTLASLSAFGRKFSGLQDEALFAHVRAEWNSQTEGPIVSLPLDDGTHLEAPLLHHALACRNKELATRLIELGVSLESVDSDGRTPLHVACCYGYGELARFLISKGAKASAKDYCGLFPLHWLWMFEDADIENIGDQLIHVAGADINASVEGSCKIDVFYGYKIQDTALHAAVAVRSLKAVLVLLKLGADVNSRPFDYSDTPLELAAQLHLPEIAQVLLKRGAGLRHENNRGVWAMHQVGEHMAPLVRYRSQFTKTV
jgi:ankyrin repeat protein